MMGWAGTPAECDGRTHDVCWGVPRPMADPSGVFPFVHAYGSFDEAEAA